MNIHLLWISEDNIIRLFMLDAIIIFMLRIIIEAIRIAIALFLFEHILKKIIIGIIFCQVVRSTIDTQEKLFPIFTIQLSNGNIPIFITTDIIIRSWALPTSFCPALHLVKKMYAINKIEERVWNKKKINTFSFFFSAIKNMINPIELISNNIQ